MVEVTVSLKKYNLGLVEVTIWFKKVTKYFIGRGYGLFFFHSVERIRKISSCFSLQKGRNETSVFFGFQNKCFRSEQNQKFSSPQVFPLKNARFLSIYFVETFDFVKRTEKFQKGRRWKERKQCDGSRKYFFVWKSQRVLLNTILKR